MLKQRIITAIILALIVVGCLLQADSIWTRVLFTVVLFMATRELILLCLRTSAVFATGGALCFAALFWWSQAIYIVSMIYWQSLSGAVLWIVIAIALVFYRHSGNWALLARVAILAIGLDLLWICAHGLVFLHQQYGGEMLLFVLSLVWVADIGAYFSGRKFGRSKLAPAISPGKTREGVLGGLAANLLWIPLVYQYSQGWGLSLLQFILVGMIASLASVVGDLFESVLKREAGVKDSGKSLPGHGGILDRIDSVIAATPVYISGVILASQL
jgi:phosphatidate cytidylyltransferase